VRRNAWRVSLADWPAPPGHDERRGQLPGGLERRVNGLLHLFGQPSPLDGIDPARTHQELIRAVLAVLAALCAKGPVTMVIADLHWASLRVLELLEAALARLRTTQVVALLHYAPIQDTVEGEPLEIYPFLGSSRLEEPLNRYPVSLVVHGHAHRGQLQGATTSGVPVYNVSMPLLTRSFADRPPFRVFEVPAGDAADNHPATGPIRQVATTPAHDVRPQLVGSAVGERRSGERRG